MAGLPNDALAACETTLALALECEVTLGDAACFAVTPGRRDRAIEYWRRLLKVNPWQVSVYFRVGLVRGGVDREPDRGFTSLFHAFNLCAKDRM